ncbi:MAG: hypothetical protein LBT25_04130 [Candidatus Symbiothrix sp.]|jgi:hypothetical protein|nr:hypothetical protein [Candidatus Symbiothrix sp.]
MKRVFYYVTLLFSVLLIGSCTNEEQQANNEAQQIVSVQKRYAIAKDIAVYHSMGLDFAYSKLQNLVKAQGPNFLRSASAKQEKEVILADIMTEFFSQAQIKSELSAFDSKFLLKKLPDAGGTSLRSGDQEAINLNKEKCYFRFYKAASKSIDLNSEELLARFDKIIYSKEFLSLSEADQNEFLMMLAIQEDSSNYWENHLAEWKQLKADGVQLRGGFWYDLKRAVCEVMVIAITDSNGSVRAGTLTALASGVGGAVVGAFGGFAGAVAGAGTGAMGGFAFGVVYGALDASMDVACEEAEWCDEDNTEEEWFEPIWEAFLVALDEWEAALDESEE